MNNRQLNRSKSLDAESLLTAPSKQILRYEVKSSKNIHTALFCYIAESEENMTQFNFIGLCKNFKMLFDKPTYPGQTHELVLIGESGHSFLQDLFHLPFVKLPRIEKLTYDEALSKAKKLFSHLSQLFIQPSNTLEQKTIARFLLLRSTNMGFTPLHQLALNGDSDLFKKYLNVLKEGLQLGFVTLNDVETLLKTPLLSRNENTVLHSLTLYGYDTKIEILFNFIIQNFPPDNIQNIIQTLLNITNKKNISPHARTKGEDILPNAHQINDYLNQLYKGNLTFKMVRLNIKNTLTNSGKEEQTYENELANSELPNENPQLVEVSPPMEIPVPSIAPSENSVVETANIAKTEEESKKNQETEKETAKTCDIPPAPPLPSPKKVRISEEKNEIKIIPAEDFSSSTKNVSDALANNSSVKNISRVEEKEIRTDETKPQDNANQKEITEKESISATNKKTKIKKKKIESYDDCCFTAIKFFFNKVYSGVNGVKSTAENLKQKFKLS